MSDRPGPEEPWFRRWFGEEYLRLYPHRDEEEAGRAVELLTERLSRVGAKLTSPGPEMGPPTVLDLACGAGRHLQALARRGISAIGLDLSLHLLEEAHRNDPDALLLRGDMRRLPFADSTFSVVTSFFTSFGYFETEAEDRRVLQEVCRVVRSGGFVFLDFLNASEVRSGLRAHDVRTIGGQQVEQRRRLVEGGRRVEKRIRISDGSGGPSRHFTERVRLYESDELIRLLEAEGLEPLELFGDYRGGPHGPDSPRTIVFARSV